MINVRCVSLTFLCAINTFAQIISTVREANKEDNIQISLRLINGNES